MGQIFFASLSQEQIYKYLCTRALVTHFEDLILFSNIKDISSTDSLIFAFKYPLHSLCGQLKTFHSEECPYKYNLSLLHKIIVVHDKPRRWRGDTFYLLRNSLNSLQTETVNSVAR